MASAALPQDILNELNELTRSLDALERARYLSIASTCVLVYDYFLTFHDEVSNTSDVTLRRYSSFLGNIGSILLGQPVVNLAMPIFPREYDAFRESCNQLARRRIAMFHLVSWRECLTALTLYVISSLMVHQLV